MAGRPSAKVPWRWAGRVLCVLALGALVGGCDRCGDWWWAPKQSLTCKDEVPRRF